MNLVPLRILTILLLAFMPLSCRTSSNGESGSVAKSTDRFTIKGVMKFINIETGCWYLETPSGEHFELAGEDLHQLLVQDREVEVEVKPLPGVSSICQVGTPVEVLAIVRVWN